MSTLRQAVVLLCAGSYLGLALPSSASNWIFRLHGVYVDTSGSFIEEDDGIRQEAETGEGIGGGVGIEYLVSRRFGLEVTAFTASIDVAFDLDLGDSGASLAETDFDQTPISLLLRFHPKPTER